MAKRLPAGEPTSAQRLLEGALSAMMTALFAGEVPTGAGVEEALTLAGLNDGQDFELSAKRMAASNVDSMMEAVRSASDHDLQMAREELEGAYRYAEARVRLEKALYPDGVSMPGLELVRPENPLGRGLLIPPFLLHSPEDREIARNRISQYEAADRLLAHLPPAFHRFLLPSNQAELPNESQDLRNELASYLDAFKASHPEDAEILRQASDSFDEL